MKRCNHCKQVKDTGLFRPNRAKCIECERAYDRQRYTNRKDYIHSFRGRKKELHTKTCPITGQIFTTSNPLRIYSKEGIRQIRALRDFARPTQREIIIKRYNGKCAHCGVITTNELHRENSAHIDHVTPTTLGGTNTLNNMQLLCALCNHRKRLRDYGVERSLENQHPEIAEQAEFSARNVSN